MALVATTQSFADTSTDAIDVSADTSDALSNAL
ncbi:MAG: hypothetical protein ACI81R_003046, partial [Bradymonadia bacterium]